MRHASIWDKNIPSPREQSIQNLTGRSILGIGEE